MTECEYLRDLEDIRKRIRENKLAGVKEELEELYNYKPVRLLWFLTKQEYRNSQGEIYADECSGKYGVEIYNSNIDLIFENQKSSMLKVGVVTEYQRVDYISNLLSGKGNLSYEESCLKESKEKFIQMPDDIAATRDLMKNYYISNNPVIFYILRYYLVNVLNGSIGEGETYESIDFTNYGYLEEKLADKSAAVLISEDKTHDECDILSYTLKKIGWEVYIISEPVEVEMEEAVQLKDTLEISLMNQESFEDADVIPAISIVSGGKAAGDNIDYILDYIIENKLKDHFALVFCSGGLFDQLVQRDNLKKRIERMTNWIADKLEEKFCFGWCGSYLKFISDLYDYEVEKELYKKAEVDYSIVIPARNSAFTLRKTIESCLNQTYTGSYEIVISDNSTVGNQAVELLVKEMNDSRIKYYKTPRNLPLSRSFEFAFLHAKGEFIFAIGSDDGVLPWALETLEKIREKYPDEPVIQWERGLYAWPDFNGNQENQLIIPRNYKQGVYGERFVEDIEYIKRVVVYPDTVYNLPLLYINSGFRKDYIHRILKESGRLWDGSSQDVYMGILNVCINKHILNIEYPLTIAGMSSGSLGYLERQKELNREDKEEMLKLESRKEGNAGMHILSVVERMIPDITTDKGLLYLSILSTLRLGVFPEWIFYDYIGVNKIFAEVMSSLSIMQDTADIYIQRGRYCAQKLGEEFLKWYDEKIDIVLRTPRYIKLNESGERSKNEQGQDEIIQNSGNIYDASDYGVENVYDACILFQRLSGLH